MSSDSKLIPLAVPHLTGNEWAYVKECLDTNWVSYVGPFVDRFERELAQKVGARQAVATTSGTAALHIALMLADVRPDDEVVMPGLSFIAPANAIRYCGAWPVFTDIRSDDWQWDIGQVADFLDKACTMRDRRLVNKATGRRIAALLPVHLLGGMCDIDALAAVAAQYELPVIEDAAECLGATYKGRQIGTPIPNFKGPFRLIITSFNGNKIITAGGGGAIFAEDAKLASQAKHLTTTAKADKMEFYHDAVGYNYRMTNIAAALGVAQLEQLDDFVENKRAIAGRYNVEFGELGCIPHPEPAFCRSTFWLYTVKLPRLAAPVLKQLNETHIQARPLWYPLWQLPMFSGAPMCQACPHIESLYKYAVSLPCSVGLGEENLESIVHMMKRLLSEAHRTQ